MLKESKLIAQIATPTPHIPSTTRVIPLPPSHHRKAADASLNTTTPVISSHRKSSTRSACTAVLQIIFLHFRADFETPLVDTLLATRRHHTRHSLQLGNTHDKPLWLNTCTYRPR